jgi:hypothetical protein
VGITVALLLQGALGGALLVIVVLVLLMAVVVAAAIFGGALEDEGGAGGGSAQSTQSIIPPGTILATMGLGLAILGAFYGSAGINFLGIFSGAMAYYRGARVLGVVASVLSFATIFIGYYLGISGAYQFDF